MVENTTLYRSPGLKRGQFRILDSLHLHVDGGGRHDLLESLLKDLEGNGYLGKLTLIASAFTGPQRSDFPETYAVHTPGASGEEAFDYFSTLALSDLKSAVRVLKEILPRLSSSPNVVVEVERVVATLENGQWRSSLHPTIPDIAPGDVGFMRAPTLPFEIHHAFDLRGDLSRIPSFEVMARDLIARGVAVGGWFAFLRDPGWSYRSNAFISNPHFERVVREEHDAISSYLRERGLTYTLWTIVEQVLGIWKTPVHSV